jgi:thiol:disulfide interchange protein DsbC
MKNGSRLLAVSVSVLMLVSFFSVSYAKDTGKSKQNISSDQCPGCKDLIGKLLPNAPIDEVVKVTDGPIYQVVVDKKVLYTDGSRHIMLGAVMDMQSGVNITQAKFEQINRVDFSVFPLDKAILVKGNGQNKKKMLIFHDVDCPYCKKLVGEIPQISNDIDVYVYLFPLTSIHPQALDKSVTVWCSSNRAEALDRVTVTGAGITNIASCITPIPDILKLGEKYGVIGTPTIFLSNGERIGGYVSAIVINEKLSGK